MRLIELRGSWVSAKYRTSNCHLVAGRSLSDLVASRLALRAMRAATALTRPNRSAQRLACSRHAVPTVKTIGPNNVVTNHCVERGDHLTHHRHDRDLRLLSGLEAVMERLPMSAASLPIRRRERRCSIASSSSLEAFSAATFSALSWRRRASILASRSAAGVATGGVMNRPPSPLTMLLSRHTKRAER
jgi:hypothetical protein